MMYTSVDIRTGQLVAIEMASKLQHQLPEGPERITKSLIKTHVNFFLLIKCKDNTYYGTNL
jgi:hypothetical protein